jgi:hypothetical protein
MYAVAIMRSEFMTMSPLHRLEPGGVGRIVVSPTPKLSAVRGSSHGSLCSDHVPVLLRRHLRTRSMSLLGPYKSHGTPLADLRAILTNVSRPYSLKIGWFADCCNNNSDSPSSRTISSVRYSHFDLLPMYIKPRRPLSCPEFEMSQNPGTRSPIQRLLNLIDEYPDNKSGERWNYFDPSTLNGDELQFAYDHALQLYFDWLTEDLRRFWLLLDGKKRGEAWEGMKFTTRALSKLAEDHFVREDPHAFQLTRNLVTARWASRWKVIELQRKRSSRS